MQEFLAGEEFAVDVVTRDGEHKCVALWRYQKGEASGAPFVNFADELIAVTGERELALVQYAFAALSALGWRWGSAHVELKWVEGRGPVLVEPTPANKQRLDESDARENCGRTYNLDAP